MNAPGKETNHETMTEEPTYHYALPLRTKLGGYAILRVLGQDITGYTYLAQDEEEPQRVIIEEYLPDAFAVRDMPTLKVEITPEGTEHFDKGLALFLEESARLTHIDHPAVVGVSRVMRALGTGYRVLQRLDGESLSEIVQTQTGAASECYLRPLLCRLLEGLQAVHEQQGRHGDIRPENIIITKDAEPVLTRFGLARAFVDACDGTPPLPTPYTPPESLKKNGHPGATADLYALGATFREIILTVVSPQHHGTPLTSIPALQRQYDRDFLQSIDKAMARHEEDRWQSAQEWLDTLQQDETVSTPTPAATHEDRVLKALPEHTSLGGAYTIRRVLSQNGFAITYLAHDEKQNIDVLIKECAPQQFTYREELSLSLCLQQGGADALDLFRKRQMEEARLLYSLDHPRIVSVLRAFSALNTVYTVMPCLSGAFLDRAVEYQPALRCEEHLLPLLKKVLEALHHLHQEGVMHLALKPANIFLTEKAEPVLFDFTEATAAMNPELYCVVESPGYTATEQLHSGGNVGPWTDIYALGATMYHLITGEHPMRSVDRQCGEDNAPHLFKRPDLQRRYSTGFLRSIDKAFSPFAEERWQSAREWLQALTEEEAPPFVQEIIDLPLTTNKEPDAESSSFVLP